MKYFVTFQKPPNTARHDELVSLVERMLELYKQSAVVRSPLDKERVGRVPGRLPGIIKIESTDKSIDRLVYELSRKGMIYGLSEEEIGIVES